MAHTRSNEPDGSHRLLNLCLQEMQGMRVRYHRIVGLWMCLCTVLTGCASPNPSVATRHPLWTFSPGLGTIADPIVDAGRVYLGYRKSSESFSPAVEVCALDAATGRQLWSRSVVLAGRFRSQGSLTTGLELVAAGGYLYFVSDDERVHAVDGENGHDVWQSAPVFSFLAATPDAVYVLDQSQRMVILHAKQGSVQRQTSLRGDESSRVRLTDALLLFYSSKLEAFDLRTMAPRWTLDDGVTQPFRLSVHVGEDRLFVDDGQAIRALDEMSGRTLWTYRTPSPVQAIDGALLYYTVYDPNYKRAVISALDRRTGVHRATLPVPEFRAAPYGALIVGGGQLYLPIDRPHNLLSGITGSRDSAICAVDAASGEKLWCSPWQYEYLHSPVLAGGLVIVGTTGLGGRPASTYAFRAGPSLPVSSGHGRSLRYTPPAKVVRSKF